MYSGDKHSQLCAGRRAILASLRRLCGSDFGMLILIMIMISVLKRVVSRSPHSFDANGHDAAAAIDDFS